MKTVNLLFIFSILILVLYLIHTKGIFNNIDFFKNILYQEEKEENNDLYKDERILEIPTQDELTRYAIECIENMNDK